MALAPENLFNGRSIIERWPYGSKVIGFSRQNRDFAPGDIGQSLTSPI